MSKYATTEPMAISISEAAQRLSIGRTTCYELARSGEIPTIKLGARHRVPVRAIEKLLESAGPAR